MSARDSRGRFVSDREQAATLLLEAALKKALADFAATPTDGTSVALDRVLIADELAEATRCADLLLAGDR